MIKEKVKDYLQQFQNAKNDDEIMEIFNSLRNLIIHDVNDEVKQDAQILSSAFSTLNKMHEAVQENRNKYYIKTFSHIYGGNKTSYFTELKKYIIQYKNDKSEFTYENAYKNILRLIFYLLKDDVTYKSYINKLSSILNTHIPESAFCAYVKYLTKTHQNQGSHIKALQQILEIDNNWYAVHVHLGDMCQGRNENVEKWRLKFVG